MRRLAWLGAATLALALPGLGGATAPRGHLALFPGKGGAATVWKLGDL